MVRTTREGESSSSTSTSSPSPSSAGEASLLPLHYPNNTTASTTTATNSSSPRWPTIDGPLGLSESDSLIHARRFYKFGFLLLPLLWAVNCFYFWPVLRHSHSFPSFRRYVVRSAIGFSIATVLLSSWALTFSIGGERLFGPVWNKLVMYNVADELGLTGWM